MFGKLLIDMLDCAFLINDLNGQGASQLIKNSLPIPRIPSTVFFLLFFSCPCSSKIVWYEKFLPFFFLLWGGEYLLFDSIAQVKDISLHFSCFVGGKLEELKGDIDHLFPYRMLVSFHLRLLYDLFNLSHS